MLKARQLELSLAYVEQLLRGYITSPPQTQSDEEAESRVQTLLMLAQPVEQDEPVLLDGGVVDYKGLLEKCSSVKKESKT